MLKRKLEINEIPEMIRTCYESDIDHVLKVHETGEEGLEYCIYKTISDYITYSIEIFVIEDNNQFIGYFGEESHNGRWLTGFFILPEFRKTVKTEFWNIILEHFNNEFKAGMYTKNISAKNFLIKNGCKLVENCVSGFGPGEIFIYRGDI